MLLLSARICAGQTPPQGSYEVGSTPQRGRTKAQSLAAYEESRAQPDAARVATVTELGRFDDPEIAKLLIGEAKKAELPELRRAVATGLGRQRASPEAAQALGLLLDASGDDLSLRSISVDALARLQEVGVPVLAERWRSLNGVPSDAQTRSLKQSLLRGLARSEVDAGLELVAKAVAEGDQSERLAALNELRRAKAIPAVVQAREQALVDRDLALAVEALRQLAESSHPMAAQAAKRIADRVHAATTGISVMSRVALLEALAAILAPDIYPSLLTAAAQEAGPVQNSLRNLIPRLVTEDGFVSWTMTHGLSTGTETERIAAIGILASARQDGVTTALLPLVQARERNVAIAAIRALATRADPAAAPALRRLLRGPDEDRKAEAITALHGALRTDAQWHQELLTFARGRDLRTRLLALDLLGEAGVKEVLPLVHRAAQDRQWPLRAVAYSTMARVRSVESIPVLLARLGKETGRMREDVLDALESLTRLRFLETSRWERWWAESKADFVLPPPPVAEEATGQPRRITGTVTYYDLPMTSNRAIFVVDVSGSMSARMGTGGTTRIEEAKRQLKQVLEPLPDSHMVNIIPFGTSATTFSGRMRRLDRATKADFLQRVEALAASGGTNMHEGLMMAFEDPDVDTIYLLSDGAPSNGVITDPDQLAAEVARWNRARRIQIHCIAVGTESALLKRLAEDSGGRYTRVR